MAFFELTLTTHATAALMWVTHAHSDSLLPLRTLSSSSATTWSCLRLYKSGGNSSSCRIIVCIYLHYSEALPAGHWRKACFRFLSFLQKGSNRDTVQKPDKGNNSDQTTLFFFFLFSSFPQRHTYPNKTSIHICLTPIQNGNYFDRALNLQM